MRVLIGCECYGRVRDAFREKGHDAWSCDLMEDRSGNSKFHLKCDLREIINDGWDMMIAFPPCTHLACSGAQHFKNKSVDIITSAKEFFLFCATADIERIAIENPIGIMSSWYRKPDQIIQPYYFGENATKATCLWLKNLPKLKPTNILPPVGFYYGKKRYGNQLSSESSFKTGMPIERNPEIRAITYNGIAKAMADQWGNLNLNFIMRERLF